MLSIVEAQRNSGQVERCVSLSQQSFSGFLILVLTMVPFSVHLRAITHSRVFSALANTYPANCEMGDTLHTMTLWQ